MNHIITGILPVKIDTEINIALVIEAVGQYRTEDPQPADMESLTQFDYLM